MAKKPAEPKIILEREYIVPLRKGWLKVPKYKRASKAVKTLKEFISRHMKVYDKDLRKIKIDQILNNEIRFRGMKKPPARIRVGAKKYDNDIVRVELIDIPAHVQFAKLREEKKKTELDKKTKEKADAEKAAKATEEAKKAEEGEKPAEETKEEKEIEEKKEAAKEENLAKAKMQAKQAKHIAGGKQKQPQIQRKALAK